MKLSKDNWNVIPLGQVCEKAKTVDIRKQKGTFNYVDIGSIDSNLKRIAGIQELDWSVASSRARQIIKQGDTLFSTVRVNLERIAFVENEIPNGIASTGFTIIRANDNVDSRFIFYTASSPNFVDRVSNLQKGTAYPAVTDRIVFNEEILLPPIDEQKQIASLFQSVDNSIEQIDEQEKNLKRLEQKLVNGLLNAEPVFGILLNHNNCAATTFGEIAECDKTYPEHDNAVSCFIGLENIESGDYTLNRRGNIVDGTTFTKRFAKGDILFGKRRAYLKKVAVADFDGICSGDILVIRAKRGKILQELLPFYISSEKFIQFAITTSAGSLSPRTKWKDLAVLKVSIPDLKTQEQILQVLTQVETVITHLRQQRTKLKDLKQNLLNEILG